MAQVNWAIKARREFNDTTDYIQQSSESYASIFARRILELVQDISTQPYFGAEVPEFGRPDIRERQYHQYQVIYHIIGENVTILRVTHGARLLDDRPPDVE